MSPKVSKIDVYYRNELTRTYYVDSENRIDQVLYYDVSYDNVIGNGRKFKYFYNSCGFLDKVEKSYLSGESDSGVFYEYVYDENGNLARTIIASAFSPVLHLFEHNEAENSVSFKEYRTYNRETGEYSTFNLNSTFVFDKKDNLISGGYVYDANYNVLSGGSLDYLSPTEEITYHAVKNPFFMILNKTYSRKNLFLHYQYFWDNRITNFIETGVSQDLIADFYYSGSDQRAVKVLSSKEGYATSFEVPASYLPTAPTVYEVFMD